MTGLIPLLQHVITVGLIWLAVIVAIRIVKWTMFNSIDNLQKDGKKLKNQKNAVNKGARIADIGATAVALITVVIFALFMYNPMERSYEEMDKIAPATVDEDFVEPTKEEIEISNKTVVEKKHKEKKEAADRDNSRAMDDAREMFRETGNQAK